MMHQVAEKSWRCVSQLFCCPPAVERIPRLQAQTQLTAETRDAQVVQRTPPTFLILNISNSNLTNCIIGSNSHLTTEAKCRASMQMPEQEMHGEEKSSCDQQGAAPASPPAPAPAPSPPPLPLLDSGTISIQRSCCVIIGDHNSMHAESCHCHKAETPHYALE